MRSRESEILSDVDGHQRVDESEMLTKPVLATAEGPRRYRHLPRLPREFYQDSAYVHWQMTIADQERG